jgi:integrase
MAKKEAEAALREILLDARNTAHVVDATTISELGGVLVGMLEQTGRKPSHIEGVRYHVRKHINPLLGDLEARSVTEDDVRRVSDKLIRDSKAASTVRNVMGTLHSVLALAVERHLLDRNPCSMGKLPKAQRDTSIRFLTQDEVERVLDAPPAEDASRAERDWWPVLRLLILTAAKTGMRLGELRALRWEDLDMRAMKIRVRQSFVRGEYGSPKSRRSVRAIPLAPRLERELNDHFEGTLWRRDDDLVLAHPHTGRPLDRVRALKHFKAALKRAGVREVRLHDLRHTFATTVAASGEVSLRTLQEWMGHRDLQTTQIYADYIPGEREQEMLAAAFGELGPHLVRNLVNEAPSDAPSTPAHTA